MTTPPKFTMTNESITIILSGKATTVQKGTANFIALRNALMNEDWDAVPSNLTVKQSLTAWVKGKFTLEGDMFKYDGVVLPANLNQRISEMASAGEDPEPLFKFWEKLQKNPSWRSVNQLFGFLKQRGIPFTKEGNFLAYKSVKMDYKDHHSGEFDNSPGKTNEMPRNQISDDPNQACHEGFHVGALGYAQSFGSNDRRIVICEINPEDVVCVPFDSSQQKMRVCKYKVIGNHNGELMSSTVHEDDVHEEHEKVVDEYHDDSDEFTRDDPKPKKAKTKPSFSTFSKMNLKELLEESIEDLRQYAGKDLQIVGASKIPGGKVALVRKIMKVRK